MKIQALTIGLSVRHPQYGIGTVRTISEQTAEIRFSDVLRTIDPELSGLVPAEPSLTTTGLEQPLSQFVESTIEKIIERLGLEKADDVVTEMGTRWQKGMMILRPSDSSLQVKEVPLEVLFHKIVGIRNQLRVLEQKVNAHTIMTDADKVELQQYVSRCYGSLTTFNLLFKNKEGQFSSKGE
ncbi:MAG TPA: hypothetical protein VMH87_06200 [Pseudomonadales bacterium]|nr:hypothetical protein [Pseudomonadales bacterium]